MTPPVEALARLKAQLVDFRKAMRAKEIDKRTRYANDDYVGDHGYANALQDFGERLDALLALPDPAPQAETARCATCVHDTDYAECKANWRRPIVGVYWKREHGCTAHTPAAHPERKDDAK